MVWCSTEPEGIDPWRGGRWRRDLAGGAACARSRGGCGVDVIACRLVAAAAGPPVAARDRRGRREGRGEGQTERERGERGDLIGRGIKCARLSNMEKDYGSG